MKDNYHILSSFIKVAFSFLIQIKHHFKISNKNKLITYPILNIPKVWISNLWLPPFTITPLQHQKPSKKMKVNFQGFRLRSILIHSLWLTALGVALFRLGTANNQQLPYKEFFTITGIVLATAPWVIQLLVSTAIILTYNAGVCDLTWLVKPPAENQSRSSSSGDQEAEDGAMWNANRNLWLLRWNGVRNGFEINIPKRVEGRNGPRLQRNRTVWFESLVRASSGVEELRVSIVFSVGLWAKAFSLFDNSRRIFV